MLSRSDNLRLQRSTFRPRAEPFINIVLTRTLAYPRTILFFDHASALSGGEIALLHLARNLDPKRYVPLVVLASSGPLVAELERAGIETIILPLSEAIADTRKDSLGGKSLLKIGAIAGTLSYAFKLARLMRARRPALIHTNSLKSDLIGGLAARMARVPVLWHVRDRIASDYLPAPVVSVFRRACRLLPSYVVANSRATFETLHLPASKGRVVHDGVEVPDVMPQHTPNSAPLIGIVGRISPWKGQHIFLEAAAKVREQFPDARFQIIGSALFGEDEYEKRVHKLAAELKLDDCLEWTGFVPDVPAYMSRLSVLAHASTSGEPFGQVVTEAMALSVPVVATNGGGVPEIIQDGISGRLVPMGDALALAQAITDLLSDSARASQIGQAGYERVREHFTVALTARNIEAVYDDLLNPC